MAIYINGVKKVKKPKGAVAIGVEWDQAVDEWNRIDEQGNYIDMVTTDFNRHAIWGGMRRCTLAVDGSVNNYGANPRGDGLDLTGADGRVMVEIPKFYVKSLSPAANVYRWWISAVPKVGFEIHPAFVQRGGIERDYIYLAAYEADLEYNGAAEAYNAGHEELHSRTGKQPYTGNADCIWAVQFDGGQNEPAIGDDVGTASDDNFFIVDYLLTGGAWDGSGTGYLWLRKPGDATCGWVDNEQIDNNTQVNILANGGAGLGVNGAPAGRSVRIGDCRTLAGNIGARWGIMNIWSLAAIQLLYYIEYANANSQITIGRGIVDKEVGTGFAGELTGHDSADTNIGVNGTGSGTGTDGLTPVVWRGIENIWGNCWNYVDGYNAVDAEYRIINRDGSGVFADTLAAGDYEASIATPITSDGYISNIEYEDVLNLLFIAGAVAGSSTTYLTDYWYAHNGGEVNILLSGGIWADTSRAGIADRNLANNATLRGRNVSSRLEFV